MNSRCVVAGILFGALCVGKIEAQSLRVGIVGDQTSSRDLAASYGVLTKGIELLGQQSVQAVLHTGDIIESGRSPEQIRLDFQRAAAILDSLGRPWHLTPGDHDVNPVPFKQDSPDRSRENIFKELYGAREPGLTDSLDHSFDIDGYHFIALNSQQHLHSDPRWGNVFLARVTDDQAGWLERDLERSRGARAVVVFLHQPLWYNWGNWIKVHELLRRYSVVAVIAGHFHYSQDEGILDGIHYVVAGAAGGIFKDSNPLGPTVPQVMVMTLNERNASFQSLAIADGSVIPLAPRRDMDRLQALDIAVGQMDLAKRSSVCVEESSLYSDHTDRLAATLNIAALGNPIDTAVRIHIAPLEAPFLLTNSRFTPGACLTMQDGDCILRQSDRVAFSNNSSVQLSNQGESSSGLWSSNVVAVGMPRAGDAIRVKVRVSFESSSGEMFVEHVASALVGQCTR